MPTDQNAGRRRLTRQVRVLTLGSSGAAAAAAVALTVVIAGHAAPSGPNTMTGTTGSPTAGAGDDSGTTAPTSTAPSSAGGGGPDGSTVDGSTVDGSSTAQDQGIPVTPPPQAGGRGDSHAGSGGS
jgi:hypothetical protein